jgi:circadian clock protein KaiB
MAEYLPGNSTTDATQTSSYSPEHVALRLYIAGASQRSTRALALLRSMCEERLAGRYHLEVIDIYQQPERAGQDGIVATPTLLVVQPRQARYFVGESAARSRLEAALDLAGWRGETDGST